MLQVRVFGIVLLSGTAVLASVKDRSSFGPLSPSARPVAREYLWPDEGRMPYFQPQQIAEKSDVARAKGFDRAAHRMPFIEWYEPAASNKTETCVLFISGGGYGSCCDAARLQPAIDRFVRAGATVANLTYRTPRPVGLPIYQSSWADAQRAVRLIRSRAATRGFSPDRIGATGISAGAKTVLLLALSSRTPAYARVDALDDLPCRLAFALLQAPAYVLTDGATDANANGGENAGIVPELAFDADTAPLCCLQGGADVYSPLGSVRLYQRLRKMGVPAELHLFADRWHGFHGDANRGADGTGWDHWCDRMLAFAALFEPRLTLPAPFPQPADYEDLKQGLATAGLPSVLVCGKGEEALADAYAEEWAARRRRGVQSDLHLYARPIDDSVRAARCREFVNHCAVPLKVSVRPGESLVAVRDRVRALLAARGVHGIEVTLPAGSYALDKTLELDARDSGTPDAPVVWRAARLPAGRPGKDEGRLPQIVAGIDLPPAAFRPVTDLALLARLDREARGKVLEADISKLRFRWPTPKPMESEIGVPLALPDLFVNGRRMAIATFPAEGWCEMTKIVDRGTELGDRNLETALKLGVVKREDVRGGTFGYAEDRPAHWVAYPHIAIQAFWRYDWRETVIYAKAIDPVAKTITLGAPHSFGLGKGNPAPRRWRAVNVFEELTVPGRYAVDLDARRLYFHPPADFAAAGAGVCAAQEPTVRVKGAHDIVFDGLHFGRSSGNGLAIANSTRVTVRRCLFTDARDLALRTEGAFQTKVVTCDFYRLGGGGVLMKDGVRKTLTRGDSAIEDCLFHHWNSLKSSAHAAIAGGVGNAIRHCEMRDSSHQATGTPGNDCVFEYNVLSNICTGTDDAGAFYKGRNPSMRGNVIRYSFFRNIGRQGQKRSHGAASIYFDDGDGGDLVHGCVFENASIAGFGNFAAVFSHGGHSNIVRNCIFVDCQRAVGSGAWKQKAWCDYMFDAPSDYMYHNLHVWVDVTKPPFTTHYPALVRFMAREPDEARWNAAYDNAFVNCPLRLPDANGKLTKPGLVSGRWYTNETSVVITGDPGFVNRAAHDFNLRRDSDIYRKIPNFKPIPFGKIGLLTRE